MYTNEYFCQGDSITYFCFTYFCYVLLFTLFFFFSFELNMAYFPFSKNSTLFSLSVPRTSGCEPLTRWWTRCSVVEVRGRRQA